MALFLCHPLRLTFRDLLLYFYFTENTPLFREVAFLSHTRTFAFFILICSFNLRLMPIPPPLIITVSSVLWHRFQLDKGGLYLAAFPRQHFIARKYSML